MSLLALLVALLVLCLVFWAANRLLVAFAIGDPLATVVRVILVVVTVLWALSWLGVGPGLGLRLR